MKISLQVVVFVLTTFAGATRGEPAEKALIAAHQVLAAESEIMGRFRACGAEDSRMPFLAASWRADSYDLIFVAQEIVDRAASGRTLAIDAASLPGIPRECAGLERGARDGVLGLGDHLPEQAALLGSAVKANEDARIAKRDFDMKVGCIKGYYNQGVRDFEVIEPLCGCMQATWKRIATDAQIDAWLELSNDQAAATSDPLFVRARPELEKCASTPR